MVTQISDWLHSAAHVLGRNPLLLLAILLSLGSALGTIRVKSLALGPAAVLFVALGFSAYDEDLRLPVILGQLGLALFAYTVGVAAGPSFFATLRTGGRALLVVVAAALLLGALATLGVGHAVGLHGPVLSGVYAGALTNTPALAASLEQLKSAGPTVGYSVTYLFGVLGMLIAAGWALSRETRRPATAAGDAPPPRLEQRTFRVDVDGLPTLADLAARYGGEVVFSRVMHGDYPGHPGQVDVASEAVRPVVGDVLTVVGAATVVVRVVADLGHDSTVPLAADRSELDMRRIIVSDRRVAGRTLGELDLGGQFGATATRVRRGDLDLLASDDLVVQPGDRIRVVAHGEDLPRIAKFLGDSERAAADVNPVGLGLGLGLGLLLGLVTVPLPGGGHFALGVAAGPLVVGLLLGRLGRTGPLLWSLPSAASAALNQFGMLLFLAYAGSNAGHALAVALTSSIGPRLLLTGVVVTAVAAAVALFAGPAFAGATGPRLAGQMAAMQTQPAVLAYVNDRTNADPRVNLGYAVVYPVAMIVKVILAPILGTLG